MHPCLGQLGCFDPCLPQRPPRIDQQTLRVPHGRLGQIGQLPGDPLHTVFDLVAAQLAAGPQFRRDRVRALARRARPVPQPGTHRAAGSPNPLTRRGDPPYRLAQQPGIGRIAHVRRDHGGVSPDPAGAQQLRLGGRFCRIPLDGSVPHPTTLMKLTTRCGPAAVEGLNEALLAKAAR